MMPRSLAVIGTLSLFALSACASMPNTGYSGQSGAYGGSYGNGYGNSPQQCFDCGTVRRIEVLHGQTAVPAATGAVVGGIVGAVAAREIARHQTDSEGRRNAATIAGAAGGAAAGQAIQNRLANQYNLYIRMDNGQETTVTQNSLDGIEEGSRVRIQNGRAWRY